MEGTKILAYTLEDIVAAKNDPGANTIHWSLYDTDSTVAEYNWHIHYKPRWLKLQAICFFVLSVFSFLGVVCSMNGVDNEASVYYLATHDTENGSRGGIAIFILITLGYTTYITTWALFQAKISASMELVPHRTTPLALSFNVRMVARLAAPLAFFYLGWLAENGIKNGDWTRNNAPGFSNSTTVLVNDSSTNFTLVEMNVTHHYRNSISMPSAFSNFYQLQSVGIIKQTFGTIFPIMLFCVLFLFVTNAFNRLLVLVKLDKYQFGAALVTEEQLREGRRQLQRTKKATVSHLYHARWTVPLSSLREGSHRIQPCNIRLFVSNRIFHVSYRSAPSVVRICAASSRAWRTRTAPATAHSSSAFSAVSAAEKEVPNCLFEFKRIFQRIFASLC